MTDYNDFSVSTNFQDDYTTTDSEHIDFVKMDKFFAGKDSPYFSIFSENEVDEILMDFIDIIEVMLGHPPITRFEPETVRHADGKRQNPNIPLSDFEIAYIKSEIAEIRADLKK